MLQFSNTSPPSVSILMTVFNKTPSQIDRAVISVLNQDFTDFELIIVDDGSNLEIGKLLLNYAFNYQDKITYIRHKNTGQAMTINRALINSRGPFIGFIDADDELKTNHISQCLRYMNENYDLIASTSENVVANEKDLYVPDKYNESRNIHIDECILMGTLFGKREVFLNIGFKDIYSQDSDFFDRASKVYKTKKLNLRTYIYYLGTEGSITTLLKKRNVKAAKGQ